MLLFAGFLQSSGSEQIIALNNLGVALMEQLKFEEAADEFQKITGLNPDFAPAHVNLGIALFNLQEYERAEASFKRSLELNAEQINAHFMLGLIYRNQDKVDPAIQEFEQVNRQDPGDPSTNYYIGLLYSRQREYQQAIEYLRAVVEKEPYNASAFYNLAIALLRSGKPEEGQAAMEKFRELQGRFGTTTVGLQYLEQGQYSLVLEDLQAYLPEDKVAESPISVTFAEVSRPAGLRFMHRGPGQIDNTVASLSDLEENLAPSIGSGVAFADYNEDGLEDVFIANTGAGGNGGALFRNKGDGGFEEVTADCGLESSGRTMAPLWGDYDNDGYPDLYLINYGPNTLYRNNGDGTFSDVTEKTGVGNGQWGVSGAFVDYDHDGDLDIFVANFIDISRLPTFPAQFPRDFAGAGNVLYRNNGDGTFTDVSAESHLDGGNLKTTAVMCTDFDNSRDIDFYLVNLDSANQLFSNRRDGTFTDVAQEVQISAPELTTGLGVGDFNKDAFVDFVLPAFEARTSKLLINRGALKFEDAGLWQNVSGDILTNYFSSQFLDYDNDGDLDILLTGRGLTLLRNQNGSFQNVTRETGLHQFDSSPVRGVSVADYDNDGDLDLICSVNGASPLLLRNDGGNQNNWVRVRPRGTNSNQSGVGAKVEVRSGRLWQKLEIYGGHGLLSQSPAVAHFGLGKRDKLDIVRVLWPGGVLQSEIDQPINQVIEVQELDRKGTSCPILYTWDGESYRFQTDFLGGSAYGYLLAPGVYNHPDTDEYVKLDRRQVALKDGKLAITMNNQLEEVILFDQLELVAVDHPAGYDIVPDEKLLPGPPYADFKVLTLSQPRLPLEARDGTGRDILSEISRIDRIYPENFARLPFKGYAEEHEIVLDLGPVSDERTVLIMRAWIDYADSTSNLAAHQAGAKLIPPYLQVKDSQGRWVTVIERMGFPAGLPKDMTVDLSGKFLSNSRQVRIVTSMRIYWDQILVESGPARDDYRISRLSADYADLHFYGFPATYKPDGRGPEIYDYRRASARAPWKAHIGGYTRYGDVLPLLSARDDMFVITRSGDEIEAFFDIAELPKLPSGWVRDYLIYAAGFGKDMDPNSASPDFIGPLPFRNMTSYPYSEGENYPDDKEHQRYLREWNTRTVDRWFADLRPRRIP